ncbi:DUF4296 domain-containing protein [candidate division KSB1 bacterium]|nr:DUF4296 domain-containing protein [candidate division KSB1 bacterium]NIR71408.1 DUF4296 domain-containing protein [candidate division KSB1 bacterium]NIS26310.1 DUF4296 domain-containing protein [candidate division KSB1 bacterium]NIT73073.1 DUF4296 domain-containing protein [candidate division KSB1 bacterium]NIU26980.1 DUF4296 domain-containing protein [candidate division KSB1 bacterium]
MPKCLYSLIFATVCLAQVAWYCSKNEEVDHIDPQLFAKIYTDMLIASLDTTETDSVLRVQEVLDEYDVSKDEYKRTIDHFENNPELWQKVFSKVVENLEQIKNKKEKEPQTEN